MKKFIGELLDKDNPRCAKTLVGIIGSLSLIIAMFIWHSDVLIDSVLMLSIGALSITGFEAIFSKNKKEEVNKSEEENNSL